MSKIISVHVLEPLPGVTLEDYEKVLLEAAQAFQTTNAIGWRTYISKGDRGVGKGKYALIHEFDSMEARQRYFPVEGGEPTEETQKVFRSFELSGLNGRWNALVKEGGETGYTDYVFVGE